MLISCAIFTNGNAVITTAIAAGLIPSGRSYSPNQNMGLGLFLLPLIVYLLTTSVLFICGRCLQINCTVNFTKLMPRLFRAASVVFAFLCLFSVLLDIAFFAGSFWFAYIIVFVLHGLITGGTIYLLNYQSACVAELAFRVLRFHNFLIDYRQTPPKKTFKRHLVSPMEPIAEAESQYEQSVMSTSMHRQTDRQDMKLTTSHIFVMDADEMDLYSLEDEDGSQDDDESVSLFRNASMNDMPIDQSISKSADGQPLWSDKNKIISLALSD